MPNQTSSNHRKPREGVVWCGEITKPHDFADFIPSRLQRHPRPLSLSLEGLQDGDSRSAAAGDLQPAAESEVLGWGEIWAETWGTMEILGLLGLENGFHRKKSGGETDPSFLMT
jgi:hypothetical protein